MVLFNKRENLPNRKETDDKYGALKMKIEDDGFMQLCLNWSIQVVVE